MKTTGFGLRWLGISLLLSACGSKPIETQEYLLRPSGVAAAYENNAETTLILHSVVIAHYLARDGIVLESHDGQIQAARYHRWAEPLDDSIRRYMQVAISRAAKTPVAAGLKQDLNNALSIDISVHQLHGSTTGIVSLVAEWQISRGGANSDVLLRHEFEHDVAISRDGYAAVVSAHRELLDGLADSIAANISAIQQ